MYSCGLQSHGITDTADPIYESFSLFKVLSIRVDLFSCCFAVKAHEGECFIAGDVERERGAYFSDGFFEGEPLRRLGKESLLQI